MFNKDKYLTVINGPWTINEEWTPKSVWFLDPGFGLWSWACFWRKRMISVANYTNYLRSLKQFEPRGPYLLFDLWISKNIGAWGLNWYRR